MSEFLEQLDEIVPDDSGKVINLANEQLKRDSNGNVKKTRNNLSLLFVGQIRG